MLRRHWLWAGMASLALGLTQPAQAQRAVARAIEADQQDPFEMGRAAFDAGRLGQALNAFETAYTLSHQPRALHRVADTADKLGEHARAISAYRDYLRLEPTTRERRFIEGRILANQAALGQGVGAAAPLPPPTAATATAPNQVARAASPATGDAPDLTAASPETSRESPAGPIWVWAGAGALAVAAIVVAGVLVGTSAASSTPASIRGNVGGTIQTLGAP